MSDPASPSGYADRRESYEAGRLTEEGVAPTPLAQFEHWYADAVAAGLPEPNAMVLATADPAGAPSARTVLLKAADARGFVFYSNHGSRKGGELAANPVAALVFPWHALQRQVCVRGGVEQVGRDETAEYFASRPWGSRIGAWASRQSQPLPDRSDLERRWAHLSARWPDTGHHDDVPVPDHWGGYLVRPVEVEFWQGRPSRLHDRLVFVASAAGAALDDAAVGAALDDAAVGAALDDAAVGAALDDAAAWRLERRQP